MARFTFSLWLSLFLLKDRSVTATTARKKLQSLSLTSRRRFCLTLPNQRKSTWPTWIQLYRMKWETLSTPYHRSSSSSPPWSMSLASLESHWGTSLRDRSTSKLSSWRGSFWRVWPSASPRVSCSLSMWRMCSPCLKSRKGGCLKISSK